MRPDIPGDAIGFPGLIVLLVLALVFFGPSLRRKGPRS
jgi:hypothetical protein